MPTLEVATEIRATRERCFDLARDIGVHTRSLAGSDELAVAGRASGLIALGEEVTFRARHFGLVHEHTARITAFEPPRHFRDSMVRGRFRVFEHDHLFEELEGLTVMRDIVRFESPFGLLGAAVDRMVLARYLRRVLEQRGQFIRTEAERASEGRCEPRALASARRLRGER